MTLTAGLAALSLLGVAVGVGVAAWSLKRGPRADVEAMRGELEADRAAMRREFAAALEEAAEIGETIRRHRARVEGAAGAAAKREAAAAEAATPREFTLEDVRALARAKGVR